MSAEQVESLWSGLFDNSGQPLSGGKVHTFAAGTSTPANLYANQEGSLGAPNPIPLDSYGRALVYADGAYKFVVNDANDVTQYTMDNLTYGMSGGAGGGQSHWGGPASGSGNNFTINPFPAITGYAQGDRFTFIAGATNTGPVTLSVNGLPAVPVRKGSGTSELGAGDIQAGNIVDLIYNATGPKFLPTNGTDYVFHATAPTVGRIMPIKVLTGGPFVMAPDTTDGSDTTTQRYGNETELRGGFASFSGNEAANPGLAALVAGNVANGMVQLTTVGAQRIMLTTNNLNRWGVEQDGHILPAGAETYDLGGPANKIRNIHIGGDLLKTAGAWTPVITAKDSMTVADITPAQGDYCRIGPFMFFRLAVNFTLGGTASAEIYFSLPMTAALVDGINAAFGCALEEGGGVTVPNSGRWRTVDADHAIVFKPSNAPFALGTNAAININGFYRVA